MKKADLCEILGVVFTLTAVLYFAFPLMATALHIQCEHCEQCTHTGFALTAFATLIAGLRFFGSAKY